MKHFVKYDDMWWEYSENSDLQCATIHNPHFGKREERNITSCEKTEAESFADLNWYKTMVYNNKFITGWVSPQGVFYGCDYRCHSLLARFILHKDDITLEKEGYMKIGKQLVYGRTKFYIDFNSHIIPTQQQINYIYENFKDDKETYDEMMWAIRSQKARHYNNNIEKQ